MKYENTANELLGKRANLLARFDFLMSDTAAAAKKLSREIGKMKEKSVNMVCAATECMLHGASGTTLSNFIPQKN